MCIVVLAIFLPEIGPYFVLMLDCNIWGPACSDLRCSILNNNTVKWCLLDNMVDAYSWTTNFNSVNILLQEGYHVNLKIVINSIFYFLFRQPLRTWPPQCAWRKLRRLLCVLDWFCLLQILSNDLKDFLTNLVLCICSWLATNKTKISDVCCQGKINK